MKYSAEISQKIPKEQVEIIAQALDLLEIALKAIPADTQEYHSKVFDILTIKALLRSGELITLIPMDEYKNFTARNNVDFPKYIKGI